MKTQYLKSRTSKTVTADIKTSVRGSGLHFGLLTQVTARLEVGLSLHLDGDGVEVVGGVTGLRHFSQDGLSVHRFICRETEVCLKM